MAEQQVINGYTDKLHGILKDAYGDNFTHTPESFAEKMQSDTVYAEKIYSIFKDAYGDNFTHTPESFNSKVGLGVKKKDGGEELEDGLLPYIPKETKQKHPLDFSDITLDEESSPESDKELITPLKDRDYSPTMTVGGRKGRFNFNEPPEEGGTPGKRYRFETEDGGVWNYQLEKDYQGGRWEDAEHAEADFKRYKKIYKNDPQGLRDKLEAMWGHDPIYTRIYNAVLDNDTFEKLKVDLASHNTHRQISEGEPGSQKYIEDPQERIEGMLKESAGQSPLLEEMTEQEQESLLKEKEEIERLFAGQYDIPKLEAIKEEAWTYPTPDLLRKQYEIKDEKGKARRLQQINETLGLYTSQGQEVYNDLLDLVGNDTYDYFISGHKQERVKETLLEKYGNENERLVDIALMEFSGKMKSHMFFAGGLLKMLDKGLTSEEIVDNAFKGADKFLSDREIKAKKIRDLMDGGSDEDVEEGKKKLKALGYDPEGWMNFKTGYRNKELDQTPEQNQHAQIVNQLITSFLKTPREQLKDIVLKSYVIYDNLLQESKETDQQIKEWDKVYSNASLLSTQVPLEHMTQAQLLNKQQLDMADVSMEILSGKKDVLHGAYDRASELQDAKAVYEASARALYLNESPVNMMGGFWGGAVEKSKMFGKAAVESLMKQRITNKWFGTDYQERKENLRRVMNEEGFQLTDEEKEALELHFSDDFINMSGGITGIIGELMLYEKFGNITGLMKNIARLKGIGKWKGLTKTDKLKRISGTILEYAWEDFKFQAALDAKPGAGAMFTGTMKLWNKVPFLKYVSGESFLKSLAKGALKTDVSLTAVSAMTSVMDAMVQDLMNNKDYRYELEKVFGKDRDEVFYHFITEGSVNWMFGLKSATNERSMDRAMAETKMGVLHKFFKQYEMKEEAEGVEQIMKEYKTKLKTPKDVHNYAQPLLQVKNLAEFRNLFSQLGEAYQPFVKEIDELLTRQKAGMEDKDFIDEAVSLIEQYNDAFFKPKKKPKEPEVKPEEEPKKPEEEQPEKPVEPTKPEEEQPEKPVEPTKPEEEQPEEPKVPEKPETEVKERKEAVPQDKKTGLTDKELPKKTLRKTEKKPEGEEPKKPEEKKEPWEIARDDYIQDNIKGLKSYALNEKVNSLSDLHKESVKQAIAEGKPVPPEILNDYPEFKNLNIKYAKHPDGKLKTKSEYTPEEWKEYTKSVIDQKFKLEEKKEKSEISDRGIKVKKYVVIDPYRAGKLRKAKKGKEIKRVLEADQLGRVVEIKEKSIVVEHPDGKKSEFTLEQIEEKEIQLADQKAATRFRGIKAGIAKGPSRTQKALEITPADATQVIMQHFIGGGRLNAQDYADEGPKGGRKSSEFKERTRWGLSDNALHFDQLAESLEEQHKHLKLKDMGRDFDNLVMEVLRFKNRGEILSEFERVGKVEVVKDDESIEDKRNKRILNLPDELSMEEGSRVVERIADLTGQTDNLIYAANSVFNGTFVDWVQIKNLLKENRESFREFGLTDAEIRRLVAIADSEADQVKIGNHLMEFHRLEGEAMEVLKVPRPTLEERGLEREKRALSQDYDMKVAVLEEKVKGLKKSKQAKAGRKDKDTGLFDKPEGEEPGDVERKDFIDKAIEAIVVMKKTAPGKPFSSVTEKDIEEFKKTEEGKKAVAEYEKQYDEKKKPGEEPKEGEPGYLFPKEKITEETVKKANEKVDAEITGLEKEIDDLKKQKGEAIDNIDKQRRIDDEKKKDDKDDLPFRLIDDLEEHTPEAPATVTNIANPKLGAKSPEQQKFNTGVKQQADKWKKETGTPVIIVKTEKGLPERVRKIAQEKGFADRVGAVLDPITGKVYVVQDKHADLFDIIRSMNHEIVGHKGMEGLLGYEYTQFLNDLYPHIPFDDKVLISKRYGANKHKIAKEWLAMKSETAQGLNMTQRFYAYLRKLLRNKFGVAYSDLDIRYLFDQAKRQMRRENNAQFNYESEMEFQAGQPIKLRVDDLGFFSPTERAIQRITQEKATPEQWKVMLLKSGAKQAEMDWMDFDGFVEGKKTLTKNEVQEWAEQKEVRLEEVVLDDRLPKQVFAPQEEIQRKTEELNQSRKTNTLEKFGSESQEWKDEVAKHDELRAWLKENAPGWGKAPGSSIAPTKFSTYQLPGGEKYKEWLITLPRKEGEPEPLTELPEGYHLVFNETAFENRKWSITPPGQTSAKPFSGNHPNEETAIKAALLRINDDRRTDFLEGVGEFKSGHFDEPNIVVHIRTNERTDSEGKKVLFIEEIQSDWQQTGRKGGFKGQKFDQEKFNEWYVKNKALDDVSFDDYKKLTEAEKKPYHDAYLDEVNADAHVPDMPFKKTPQTTGLVIKRMVRYAAENGFSKIAWTTGKQQVERNNLSKRVERITYFANKNDSPGEKQDTYNIHIKPVNEERSIIHNEQSIEQVERLVGKEATKKIKEDAGVGSDGKWYSRSVYKYAGQLEEENLKVGGEGMKDYYDKIIPSTVNKLFKRYGVKTTTTDIREYKIVFDIDGFKDIDYSVLSDKAGKLSKEIGDSFDTEKPDIPAVKKYISEMEKEGYKVVYDYEENTAKAISEIAKSKNIVHSITLNDKLKSVAKEGMPKFRVVGELALERTEENWKKKRDAAVAMEAKLGLPIGYWESSAYLSDKMKIQRMFGVYRGRDGLWRKWVPDNYEVDHKGIEQKLKLLESDLFTLKDISSYDDMGTFYQVNMKDDIIIAIFKNNLPKNHTKEDVYSMALDEYHSQREVYQDSRGPVKKMKLTDVVPEKSELWKEYPEAKDIWLAFEDIPGNTRDASFWHNKNIIEDVLNPRIVINRPSYKRAIAKFKKDWPDDPRKVEELTNDYMRELVLHEYTHFVQEVEKMAGGNSVGGAKKQLAEMWPKVRKLNERLREIFESEQFFGFEDVLNNMPKKGGWADPELRLKIDAWTNSLEYDRYMQINRQLKNLGLHTAMSDLIELSKITDKKDFVTDKRARERYNATAGEVESRAMTDMDLARRKGKMGKDEDFVEFYENMLREQQAVPDDRGLISASEGKLGEEKPKEEKPKDKEPEKPYGHDATGLHGIQLPEYISMVRKLIGKFPKIKKMMPWRRGYFSGRGVEGTENIFLNKMLFEFLREDQTTQDTELIEKVLAHEIFHLIDYLPQRTLKRGNILGRISNLTQFDKDGNVIGWRKHLLGRDPEHIGILTNADRARLRREAKKALEEEASLGTREVIEEIIEKIPIYDETGLTPDDILKIWRTTTGRDNDPELYEYIVRMTDGEKARIMRQAMKGIIADELARRFARRKIGEREEVRTTRRTVEPKEVTPQEIAKRFQELLETEIKKRQLFRQETITKELKDLTRWWRPFNPGRSAKYDAYRHSSKELYADAGSVLLNNPQELQKRAPEFYKAFFNWFDVKADVKKVYQELQELSEHGKILSTRDKAIEEGYEEGHQARMDAAYKPRKREISRWHNFLNYMVSRNIAGLKKIKPRKQEGKDLTARQDTRNVVEKKDFINELTGVIMKDVQNNVTDPLITAAVNLHDFGKFLMFDRNMSPTDRGQVANPWGLQDKQSLELFNEMKSKYNDVQWETINKAAKNFHEIVFDIFQKGYEAGIFSEKVWNESIVPNKYTYVTYGVVEYISGTKVTALNKTMEGTFEKIENPLYTTIAKALAVAKLTRNQEAWNKYKKEFEIDNPEHFIERKARPGTIPFPKDKDKVIHQVYENGKAAFYEVPVFVKDIFDNLRQGRPDHFLLTPFRAFRRFFNPAVTTYNPGWFLYSNPLRDHYRNVINMTAILHGAKKRTGLQSVLLPFMEYTPAFLKSFSTSYRYIRGDYDAQVREMLKEGALFAGFYDRFEVKKGQEILEPIFISHGLMPKPITGLQKLRGKAEGKIQELNYPVLNEFLNVVKATEYFFRPGSIAGKVIRAPWIIPRGIRAVATFSEVQSKFTAHTVYKKYFDAETAAYFTRNYAGTPNFRERALATDILNTISPFYNVIVQSLRTGAELATTKKTAPAYWAYHAITSAFPGVAMAVMGSAIHLVNENYTEEEVKGNPFLEKALEYSKLYQKISDYDKYNYLCIIMGQTESGDPLYWRWQLGEEQRIVYALSQWTAKSIIEKNPKGLKHLANIGVGLSPSASPLAEMSYGAYDYLSGASPTDSYYKEKVIPERRMSAGLKYSAPYMAKWILNKSGLRPVTKMLFKNQLREGQQSYRLNNVPYLRMLKIGGEGETEWYNYLADNTTKVESRETIWIQEAVKDEVVKRQGKIDDVGDREDIKMDVVDLHMENYEFDGKLPLAKVGQLVDVYTELGTEHRFTNIIAALIFRHSNLEKSTILLGFKKRSTDYEYEMLLEYMFENGIISEDLLIMTGMKQDEIDDLKGSIETRKEAGGKATLNPTP